MITIFFYFFIDSKERHKEHEKEVLGLIKSTIMVCGKEFCNEMPDHGMKTITLHFLRDGKFVRTTYETFSDDDEEDDEEEDVGEDKKA